MPYIDPTWTPVEGQTGLYLESYERINSLTGQPMTMRILHSADGYCFYSMYDEYYDEEGNRIPEEEVPATMRHYYQYMAIPPAMDITYFISVPVQEGFEIVSTRPNTETI